MASNVNKITGSTELVLFDREIIEPRRIIRIIMPNCLLFCLMRVSKLRKKSVASIVLDILEWFISYPTSDPNLGDRQRNSPLQELEKYYVAIPRFGGYSYSLKDKIRNATMPRKFKLVTDKTFVKNIQQIALMHLLSLNEFILEVLAEKSLIFLIGVLMSDLVTNLLSSEPVEVIL